MGNHNSNSNKKQQEIRGDKEPLSKTLLGSLSNLKKIVLTGNNDVSFTYDYRRNRSKNDSSQLDTFVNQTKDYVKNSGAKSLKIVLYKYSCDIKLSEFCRKESQYQCYCYLINIINFLRTPFPINDKKSNQTRYHISVVLYRNKIFNQVDFTVKSELDLDINWTNILIKQLIQLDSELKMLKNKTRGLYMHKNEIVHSSVFLPYFKIGVQYYDQDGNQYQIKLTDPSTCQTGLRQLGILPPDYKELMRSDPV